MSENLNDINAGNGNNLDVESLSNGDQTNGPKSKRKRKDKQKDSNAWTWSMDKNILLLEKRIELEESFRNAYHTKNAWVKLIKALNWQIGHEVVSTKFNNLIKYYSKVKKPSTGTEGCLERDKAKAKLIELVHFFIKDSHKHHPPIVHDTADPQLTDENERRGNGIEQDGVNVSQETSNPLREQDEEPDDLAWYLQGLDEDSESEAPQTNNIPSSSQSFISPSRPSSVNSNASAFSFSTPSPTPSPAPSSTPSSTQSSTQSSTGSSNSDESRRKRKRNLTYKQIMLESQENLKDLTSQWKELKDRTCCKLYGFAGGLSGTVTIMSITAVTFERYLTINNQSFTQPYFNSRSSILVIILLWLYSLMFTLPPIFGFFTNYIPEGYLTTCSFDYISTKLESGLFVLIFFLGAWLIPLIIIIGSYVGIYRATHRSAARFKKYALSSSPPSSNNQSDSRVTNGNINNAEISNSNGTGDDNSMMQQRTQHHIRLEHRLVRTSIALITLWMITWTPYAVVSLIGIINPLLLTPTMAMLPAMFAKTSAVMDPFVYGYLHPSKTSTSSSRWQKVAKF